MKHRSIAALFKEHDGVQLRSSVHIADGWVSRPSATLLFWFSSGVSSSRRC